MGWRAPAAGLGAGPRPPAIPLRRRLPSAWTSRPRGAERGSGAAASRGAPALPRRCRALQPALPEAGGLERAQSGLRVAAALRRPGAILGRGRSAAAGRAPAPRWLPARVPAGRPGAGGQEDVAAEVFPVYFCPSLSWALAGLAFLTRVAGAVDKHLFASPLPRNAPGAPRRPPCQRGGSRDAPSPGPLPGLPCPPAAVAAAAAAAAGIWASQFLAEVWLSRRADKTCPRPGVGTSPPSP